MLVTPLSQFILIGMLHCRPAYHMIGASYTVCIKIIVCLDCFHVATPGVGQGN